MAQVTVWADGALVVHDGREAMVIQGNEPSIWTEYTSPSTVTIKYCKNESYQVRYITVPASEISGR